MASTLDTTWTDDPAEVLAFAHVLHRTDWLDTVPEALEYFEKSWKWASEHAIWVEQGRPDVYSPRWDTFRKLLDENDG